MNYIYDIFINLQKRLYDFYEWNSGDEIIHIRKIPIFKISSISLSELKSNKIKLGETTLAMLINRTEIFENRNVKNMKYVGLFGDSNEVVALQFDDDGNKCRASKLLIDEEFDVIEVLDNIEEEVITYEIKGKEDTILFRTRKENKIYDYILKQLTRDNYIKLKYLYFEFFEREEDDLDKIINDIKSELDNNWINSYKTAYSFFKLSSQRQ